MLNGLPTAAAGAAKYVVEEAQKNVDKMNRTQARVANKSDKEVVGEFRHSSGLDKCAYARELEDRGYLEKSSEGKYQLTDKRL